MDQLILRYRHDPSRDDPTADRDDFGRLSIRVETSQFIGEGGFWVQWQDLVAFGETLATYPIDAAKPLGVRWGYDKAEGDDLVVRIAIGPTGETGPLRVQVEIADDNEPCHRIKTSFLSDYPSLDQFRRELIQLMDESVTEAVLRGH